VCSPTAGRSVALSGVGILCKPPKKVRAIDAPAPEKCDGWPSPAQPTNTRTPEPHLHLAPPPSSHHHITSAFSTSLPNNDCVASFSADLITSRVHSEHDRSALCHRDIHPRRKRLHCHVYSCRSTGPSKHCLYECLHDQQNPRQRDCMKCAQLLTFYSQL
jgi:hypothetical protein